MKSKPWLQAEGEPDEAYVAFGWFRDFGPLRTLDAVWRAHSGPNRAPRAPGNWKRWKSRYDWSARAQAYDDRNDERLDEARIEAIGAHAGAWAQRQMEVREKDWQLADRLRQMADKMVDRIEESMDDPEFIPSVGDVVRLAKTVSEIQRLAAELATQQVVTQQAPPPPKDFSEMSDTELEEYIREQQAQTRH
jgi:hypothetical protein